MKLKFCYRVILLIVVVVSVSSCNDFFDPDPEVVINEVDFYQTFEDFRAAEMGLYAIQQELVEQLVILGELRSDLLEVTRNADPDMIDVHNLNISPTNKWASPVTFYKLIANCNNLLRKIEEHKPTVTNPLSLDNVDNYDRLYGSVLAMRAWAYFNAVKIFGNIPYVDPRLTTVQQIRDYLNTGTVIISDRKIEFDNNGYQKNDTTYNDTIFLERVFLNMEAVVDTFTYELNTKVKRKTQGNETTYYIGVDYNIDGINDNSWEVVVWNQYAYHVLLGQMYFSVGNIVEAQKYFHKIVYFTSPIGQENRYLLAENFPNNNWPNFYSGIDILEHIFVLPFNKGQRQQHDLNVFFSTQGSNKYMLKPTDQAVFLWENDEWRGWNPNTNGTSQNLDDDEVLYDGAGYNNQSGVPGDIFRGNGGSYGYVKNGEYFTDAQVQELLLLKYLKREKEVESLMEGVDTVVFKYMINQANLNNSYRRDINFVVYSAPSVHLYMAEILNRLTDITSDLGFASNYRFRAIQIMGNGAYGHNNNCDGVRGRVGFTNNNDISPSDALYFRDPITAEIIRARSLSNRPDLKSILFEHFVMKERAKELAFQGDRFYDLIRVSERQGKQNYFNLLTIDPFYQGKPCYYIALIVSQKFSGSDRERVFNFLNEPANWYITPEWDFSVQ